MTRHRIQLASRLGALLIAAAWLLGGGVPAWAAVKTYNVNSTADRANSTSSSTVCATAGSNPVCTLRAAIQASNANQNQTDTIVLPAGVYTLTIPGRNENAAATGDLDIMDAVNITGAGASSVIIDGNGIDRVFDVFANGTTTIEAKTGYGLDLLNEAKSFDVLRQLAARLPLRIVPTFLGAHVVPANTDRAAYLRALMEEMLPAFKAQAVFCDAWCDEPAFTSSETRAILVRAKALGYQLRMHAAQLAPGEGPEIAAELGARSADHLEFATPAQVKALAAAGTVAVLCPGANFTTHGPRPPIEAMRDAKLPMAIASDLNPGTSNSESLPHAMSLACVAWGLTPREALLGATVHAARSLGLEGRAGCLQPGSFADCVVLDVETPEAIPYYVGVNRVLQTVAGGAVWRPW